MPVTPIRFVVALCAVTALTACGGGDDGAVLAPTPTGTAEGVYGGSLTNSTSSAFEAVVLEDGSYWSLYGVNLSSTFQVAGLIQGTGTSSGGAFTSSNIKDFGITPAPTGTLTATYSTSAKTLIGSTTFPNTATVQFSGGPIPGTTYSYDAAPVLADITGNWSVPGIGPAFILAISANGTFGLTDSGMASACSASGTIAPRASGKNVYNITLTWTTTTTCSSRAGQAFTGIAITYPITATAQRQLLMAMVDATRTNALVVATVR